MGIREIKLKSTKSFLLQRNENHLISMSDRVKISIIPNDLSQDLEQVFQMCQEENLHYVELASMWGKSILDLDEGELQRVHELMDTYNLKAASIQTQIMKVMPPGSLLERPGSKNMHLDFEYNISLIDKAIDLAKEFDTPYIITYSFMGRGKGDTEAYWAKMLNVYEGFLQKLKPAGKTVCIEGDGGQYVGKVEDYLRIFNHFNSPHIQANFDVANLHHFQTFPKEDFEKMYPWVPYFHVKDRKMNTGWRKLLFGGNKPALTGEGNIPWRTIIPWFVEKGFRGIFSIEPHVHGDRFNKGRKCAQNLKAMLNELKIPFE